MKMDSGKELPQRKRLRLKNFDYSTPGAYFITICTHNRKCTLSRVVGAIHESPEIELTDYGKITDETIRNIPERYKATVDRYVIMPDHIHVIIFLDPDKYIKRKDGSSKAPTPTNEMLPHIISTFKRFCNKEIGKNIFQRGYIEHIVRDRNDYETRKRYTFPP